MLSNVAEYIFREMPPRFKLQYHKIKQNKKTKTNNHLGTHLVNYPNSQRSYEDAERARSYPADERAGLCVNCATLFYISRQPLSLVSFATGLTYLLCETEDQGGLLLCLCSLHERVLGKSLQEPW